MFPPGHRAISVAAVIYTILNHDYLRMASYGLTYSKLIGAMKSESYKKEVKKYVNAPEKMSPINLWRQVVFKGSNHINKEQGYNLHGVLLLLHHAFINRPAPNQILQKMYSVQELGDGLLYNIVRAAAIIAGKLHPLPDPTALLAHLSCANIIFRRWSVHLYSNRMRTDDELERTRYMESEVKGQRMISIRYDLCDVAESYRTWTDEYLLKKLRLSCYGYLLPNARDQVMFSVPFNPIKEVKATLKQ